MKIRKIFKIIFVILSSCLLVSCEDGSKTSTLQNSSRNRRQIGKAFRYAMREMRRQLTSIGKNVNHLGNSIQNVAEIFRENVAPSIANSVIAATNRMALSTKESLQKGAEFLSNEVAPVIEDTVVEMSNAALPVVNKGIDVVGAGLNVGVHVVSKTTSTGIEHFKEKVLGEQRKRRIRKIADNISLNFNNSINHLAGAIKSMTLTDNTDRTNHHNVKNLQTDFYDKYTALGPYRKLYAHLYPQYYQYIINNPDSSEVDIDLRPEKNMTFSQALGKIVSKKAYSLSRQYLGPNFTEAVAPLAKSVSNAFSQIPSVSLQTPSAAEKLRKCTTPGGRKGYCQELSDCPDLVLRLSVLRRSICFKGLFDPGVCCPDVGQLHKIRQAEKDRVDKLQKAQEAALAQAQQFLTQQNELLQAQFGSVNSLTPQQQQQFLNDFNSNPNLQAQLGQHLLGLSQTFKGSTNITPDNKIINKNQKNDRYECGVPKVPEYRVVGGAESHIGEWPWTAAIYLHGPKKTEFWCGGSLVSEDYIITAAHCTKDSNEKTFNADQFSVHLGDYSIFNNDDDQVSPPQTYGVRHINPHPSFRREGYFNDIALIKLSRSVDFNEYILPVCLPPSVIERSPLDALVGQTPSVIGYGSTTYDGPQSNILRDVKLPIWTNSECDKAYFQPITDIFLCAGYTEGGKDACQGDSGGPMQLYYNGRWIQLGIVSFGNRCAEPGYPGVYTRITKFLPWIRENLI